MRSGTWRKSHENRRIFIGGSDARVIMGNVTTSPSLITAPLPLSGQSGIG